MVELKIKRLHEQAVMPAYQSAEAAGLDLAAASALTIAPGAWEMVPTGLAIELPAGYEGQVRPRSGLAARSGVTVLNSPGTIDADYRGEIKVLLINHGREAFLIEPGMRIAQLVVAPVCQAMIREVAKLSASERGSGGFGHTGK